ncbi:MAG: hypothetical protein ACK4NN_12085 [Rheinheimera sp.]
MDIDHIIKEIALRHNIRLTTNDPVLIVYTMHQLLLERQGEQQQQLLAMFESHIEQLTTRWSEDTRQKSEKALQAALDASKQVMANALQQNAELNAKALQNELKGVTILMDGQIRQMKVLTIGNVAASALTLAAACGVIYSLVFH